MMIKYSRFIGRLGGLALSILVLLAIESCTSESIPKPVGYYRIELPPDTFATFASEDCPFTFHHHIMTRIQPKREKCWYDIHFPYFKSMIQLTYLKVEDDNLESLINDAHNLAFRHTVKADGIKEKLFINPDDQVYGTLYNVFGNAATATQFYLTDSSNHFIRGVVYFNAAPNEDSLRPVNEYMHKQVEILMESLRWE
ncbi:MAG: gliding motility lipoprotein GldD [Flavobacteriales bacterium]|nr:MAG: gliding motility lipoprotein GldD [Flavobacteriales bacterium]